MARWFKLMNSDKIGWAKPGELIKGIAERGHTLITGAVSDFTETKFKLQHQFQGFYHSQELQVLEKGNV